MEDVKDQNINSEQKPGWKKVTLHVLLMIVIGLAVLFITTFWLDLWTHHGAIATVPDVKGQLFDDAKKMLEDEGFEVVLQDSVYEDKARPGQVVDQNPSDSAQVKPGRTVYLTINAFYPRTVQLPSLSDVSLRQAQAALEAIGITHVVVKQVPSEYSGLVLSATHDGKRLKPGMRVPITATIVLEVGVDPMDMTNDSIHTTFGGDTSTDDVSSGSTGGGGESDEPTIVTLDPNATPAPSHHSDPSDEPDFFD